MRLLKLLAALGIVCGAFVLGFLVNERELPPYPALLRLYEAALPHAKDWRYRLGGEEGRFAPARVPPAGVGDAAAVRQDEIEALQAIGYASGSRPAPDRTGVTQHDPDLAFAGVNLYSDGHRPEARLIDMEGRELHRWQMPFRAAFPRSGPAGEVSGRDYWRRVRLLPGGELLAIYEGNGLIRLDRDSRLLWAYPGAAHHDLDVDADGRIYVLTRQAEVVRWIDPLRPVLHDFVAVLAPDGRELKRVSILEAIERSDYAVALLRRIAGFRAQGERDILHTNTLELLDGSLAERLPAFAKGNLLISILTLDTIGVLDLAQGKLVWALWGMWAAQHQPTVLENGNLLLFDNLGDAGRSRVIEFEPRTQAIVWSYGATRHDFFSRFCGSNQRLANGNTLITESDNGRAFEVTPDQRIVWEYLTPSRTGERNELIATLFELVRLDPDTPLDWTHHRVD